MKRNYILTTEKTTTIYIDDKTLKITKLSELFHKCALQTTESDN